MPSLHFRSALLAIAGLTVLVPASPAAAISTIYSFGDSLSDVGNAYALTAGAVPSGPYSNGRFSNGAVWVQDLSTALGLGPVTASAANGNNFAVGGAQTGTTPIHTDSGFDLLDQISAFHAVHATADPNALYTMWIGSNDMRELLTQNPPLNQTQVTAATAAMIQNIDQAISLLGSYGAKNLLLLTVPDLGKSPQALAAGAQASAIASGVSAAFDQSLVSSLPALSAQSGIQITVLNTYGLIDAINANPGQFGLSDATDSCLTNVTVAYATGTPCANPNSYLFWDSIHPTAAGHSLLATAALQAVVPEPAVLSMIGLGGLALLWRSRRHLLN